MIARRFFLGVLIAVFTAGVMMLGATPAMAKKTFRWGDSCFNNLRADYYGYHRFLDLEGDFRGISGARSMQYQTFIAHGHLTSRQITGQWMKSRRCSPKLEISSRRTSA